MTQVERIRAALARIVDERKLAPTAVSREAGLAHTTLGDIISGKSRNPTIESLEKLTAVMGLTVYALLRPDAEPAPDGIPGFGESEAVPYEAAPSLKEGSQESDFALARLLAPSARHASLFRLTRDMPCAGLWNGDVLVLDLAGRPQNGQLVVANVADTETAEAHTIVRLLFMPHLIDDPARHSPSVVVDNVRTTIIAPVLASFRPERPSQAS